MSPLRNEKDGGAVRCNHGGYVGIGMGNNSLPSSGRLRRAPRRLRNFLTIATLALIAFVGTGIFDNVTTRSSVKFANEFAGEFVNETGEYIQQWHDPAFLLKYLKHKPAALVIEAQVPLKEEGEEWMVPEQAGLPRAKRGRAVTQIPEEERLKLVKGLRRLYERMPTRWAATRDTMHETRGRNIARYQRLHNCILASLPIERQSETDFIRNGDEDIAQIETCSSAELNVVVGATYHFGASQVGRVSGEDIWARSTIDTFDTLGYTFLYAFETVEALDIYLEIPSLVRMIIAETSQIESCSVWGIAGKEKPLNAFEMQRGGKVVWYDFKDIETGDVLRHTVEEIGDLEWDLESPEIKDKYEIKPYGFEAQWGQKNSNKPGKLDKESPDYEPHEEWRCIKSEGYEEGIPIHKLFAWHFWASPGHPLGHQFTLAPEDYARYKSREGKDNNLFLGYSMEHYCDQPVPAEDRENRAYILAKHANYFDPPEYKYSNHIFADIKAESGLEFVAGSGDKGTALPDFGITNLGQLKLPDFKREMGNSKALVGIGLPLVSPTPYEALCMGIPFINPIVNWLTWDPEDQSGWHWQHEGLANIQPPYVYTVRHGDEDGLREAVAEAVANPIDRFIPPQMTAEALAFRHKHVVERVDWKAIFSAMGMVEGWEHFLP